MKKMFKVCMSVFILVILVSGVPSYAHASDDLHIEVDGTETLSKGEVASFYLVTTYGNEGRVDANITSALIYYREELIENLTSEINHIDTGLFWVKYSVPSDALAGTYMMLIDANYTINASEVKTSAVKAVTVSTALTELNSRIRSVERDVLAIKATIEAIEPSIGNINAILADMGERINTVEANIAAINGSITDISTSVTSISGTIDTIQADFTTLKTDIETLQSDVESLQTNVRTISVALTATNEYVATIEKNISERTSSLTTNLYIVLAISIASALAAILGFVALVELGRILVGGLKL